jgi:hypothetical protein
MGSATRVGGVGTPAGSATRITTGTVKPPPKKAASGNDDEKKSKFLEALKDFNKRRDE